MIVIFKHLIICLTLFYNLNVTSDTHCNLSMFVWQPEIITQDVIDEVVEDGFCRMYVYCSVKNIRAFEEALELCKDNNIEVYALNGSYEWIDETDRLYEYYDVLKELTMKDYTNLKGVVLDIEPYVADDFQDEDYEVFVDLIKDSIDLTEALQLKLNVVVPFWYEKIQVDSIIDVDNLASWIIMNVDEFTIMAYRNEVYGKNGVFDLIDEELIVNAIADGKMNIALETRKSSEGDNISFYNHEKNDVLNAIEAIRKILVFRWSDVNYVVHDLKSWLKLD